MATKIISDSSCDVWSFPNIDFITIPLTISTEERTFTDDEHLNVDEMLDYLARYRGRSYTACPSVQNWLNAFEGGDEIYIVTMTSTLSGTYNSAVTAQKLYREQHPDTGFLIIDTMSTSCEQLLILEKLIQLKEQGYSMEEIEVTLHNYMQHTRLFFAFQSLHNFAQNGRVPKLLAQTIGVLGISILGTASASGTVEPIGKCRGKKSLLSNLLKELKAAGYQGGKLKLCHINNAPLADEFSSLVTASYPTAQIHIYPARGICAYYGEDKGLLIGCEC